MWKGGRRQRCVIHESSSGHFRGPTRAWNCFEVVDSAFWSWKTRQLVISWKISTGSLSRMLMFDVYEL